MIPPDDIPDGLLTVPLDELTDTDLDALRQLRALAEKHDWDGVMRLLVQHSKPKTQEKQS